MDKTSNKKFKEGKWKKTEQDRFMKALAKYGKNWTMVQKAVKTRSLAQVRSHSQKLFLSMTDKELNFLQGEINQRFDSFCKNKKGFPKEEKDKKRQSLFPTDIVEASHQPSALGYFSAQREKDSIKVEQLRNADNQTPLLQKIETSNKNDINVEVEKSQNNPPKSEDNERAAELGDGQMIFNNTSNDLMYPMMPMFGCNILPMPYFIWFPY